MIRTVLGDIAPADLGRTDYHDHLFQVSPLLPGDELDDEPSTTSEAALLRGSGFDALVDATPTGLGRRPDAVARIAQATGLRIVATTGAHRSAHYADGHWLRAQTAAALAERFLSDLRDGMPLIDDEHRGGGLGPRAGLLKAGIGYWSIDSFERDVLAAVSEAHRATGAPVMVHLEFCSAAHEVLDLLADEGTPAHRVVLAHADRDPDPGLHLDLVERGAWLGYDGMARPRTRSDAELIDLTRRVVEGGGGHRILLGGDVARRSRYVSYGGLGGLAYLGERYLPRLEAAIGHASVDRIVSVNPAEFLDFGF